ncbi:divalent metal cation transporter [Candidatus Microgenomates bacterium]|nr:divalent metal cation transporter [Candidatus Microgenomates bacterium]
MKILTRLFKKLGPGLITGASDDDPAGVVIYAQTGAATGTNLAWTAPLTFPFMAGVQEMCARIGLVTGHGLIGVMRRQYPRVFIALIASLVVAANTINIGADIAGMAASLRLFVPLPSVVIAAFFSVLVIAFMVYFPYRVLANIFKWLTLVLFAYIATAFIVVSDWREVLINTIIPHLEFTREQLSLILAIFGTTISPYLFFWQASEEAEEKHEGKPSSRIVTKNELKVMREDVTVGMFFSNLVMYFIIVASAVTLPVLGIRTIQSPDQAAAALTPLAGNFATFLFAVGIIGTGMLAVPVLAGSAAYAVSEIFGWKEGLSLSWSKARPFYAVIIASTLVGLLLTTIGERFGFPPFKALIVTGIIYGILSPLLILIILAIANNKEILGDKINGVLSNTLGVATFVLMTLAVIVMVLV